MPHTANSISLSSSCERNCPISYLFKAKKDFHSIVSSAPLKKNLFICKSLQTIQNNSFSLKYISIFISTKKKHFNGSFPLTWFERFFFFQAINFSNILCKIIFCGFFAEKVPNCRALEENQQKISWKLIYFPRHGKVMMRLIISKVVWNNV